MNKLINEYTKNAVLPKALRQLQELIWRALKLFWLPLGLFRLPFGGGAAHLSTARRFCSPSSRFVFRHPKLFSDTQHYFLTSGIICLHPELCFYKSSDIYI